MHLAQNLEYAYMYLIANIVWQAMTLQVHSGGIQKFGLPQRYVTLNAKSEGESRIKPDWSSCFRNPEELKECRTGT